MAYNSTAVPSAARTTSGDSGALTYDSHVNTLRVQLNVTAASGTTPTLDLVLEDTLDGGATWNSIVSFTQATAVSRQVVNVASTTNFSDTIRLRWTIGGVSPSVTFAVIVYSEP